MGGRFVSATGPRSDGGARGTTGLHGGSSTLRGAPPPPRRVCHHPSVADPGVATAARPTARGELRGLTALRFVAATMVLLHHQADVSPLPFGLTALGHVGFVGVDFFFVLSGFVLTWSHREGQRTTTFWRRRIARVYPLHVVGWFAALGLTLAHDQRPEPLLAWGLALILVQAWVPRSEWAYSANGVSWSLSCEALFYATFPWLRPLVARLSVRDTARTGFAVYAVMLLAVVVVRAWNPAADAGNPGVLYTDPLYRLGEFALGIVLARAVAAGWRPRCPAWAALGVTLLAWLTVATVFARLASDPDLTRFTGPAAIREIGGLVLLPLLVLVVATVATDERAGTLPRWLGSRVAVMLGRWSFAFYVVHQLVVHAFEPALPTTTAAQQLVALAVVGAVSLLLAAVLHHAVEVPLARRWREPPSV